MSYGYHYSSGEPAFAIFMMIFTMIYILVMFGIVAATYISRWFIFKKMGMPGWKGIIPYYGEYLLFRELWTTKMFWAFVISGAVYAFVSIFAMVFGMVGFAVAVAGAHSSHGIGQAALIPILAFAFYGLLTIGYLVFALVVNFKLNNRLAKAFGKSTGFAAGLTFLSPIFDLILAFDKSYYIGRQAPVGALSRL